MSGVSYASPTYYADRLCERGRLYIRAYYNGDEPAHKAMLDDAKHKKAEAQKKLRQKMFGHAWHERSRKEKEKEKKDAEELTNHLRQLTWDAVNRVFCPQPKVPEPGRPVWRNPYGRELRDTMFWM